VVGGERGSGRDLEHEPVALGESGLSQERAGGLVGNRDRRAGNDREPGARAPKTPFAQRAEVAVGSPAQGIGRGDELDGAAIVLGQVERVREIDDERRGRCVRSRGLAQRGELVERARAADDVGVEPLVGAHRLDVGDEGGLVLDSESQLEVNRARGRRVVERVARGVLEAAVGHTADALARMGDQGVVASRQARIEREVDAARERVEGGRAARGRDEVLTRLHEGRAGDERAQVGVRVEVDQRVVAEVGRRARVERREDDLRRRGERPRSSIRGIDDVEGERREVGQVGTDQGEGRAARGQGRRDDAGPGPVDPEAPVERRGQARKRGRVGLADDTIRTPL